jgi:hypothetical protein
MNTRKRLAGLRNVFVALLAAFFITACGGSGSSTEPLPEPVNFGTVGLWFTDLPTQDFQSIILTVNSATLIGEDDSHHLLFDGQRKIDLLDLTNYSEPVMFGQVRVGTYKKIRLMIESIELVPVDAVDEDDSIFAKVPANGKVDLLQADGFDVLPGRTVMVELDVDANKAFKVTNAGNSGKVNFRPVVKVNVYYDDGVPPKLVRLEGAVGGDPDGANGAFVLCSIDAPDYCIDVSTDTMTSFFDDVGLGTDFGGLADGAMVTVIGEYSSAPIFLDAFVVQIGGNNEQLTGEVVSEPANSQFLVLTIGGEDVTIELQPGTKYYDASGPIGSDAVVLGATVEVEGVLPAKADPADPDLMRAAIVFLEAPDADLLSGTIVTLTPADADAPASLQLQPEDVAAPEVCVVFGDGTRVLLVSATDGVVTEGNFDSLAVDQVVDVFGGTPEGESCFVAEEVIVDADASP